MSSIQTHPAFHFSAYLDAYQPRVDKVLHDMMNDRVVTRLWDYDHTLWKPEDTDISNRLGWLHSARAMRGEQERLSRFVESVRDAGYTQALLLGMGGSSLAPAVFGQTYGYRPQPSTIGGARQHGFRRGFSLYAFVRASPHAFPGFQ